jgi:CDP-paratose 2-epimerase
VFAVRRAMQACERVFHLAAQVAVTTSLEDPHNDLDVNVKGTVNVLEEARRLPEPPSIVFTSTNKVYGRLEALEFLPVGERYEPVDELVRSKGIAEHQPMEFCSPYGCSKGAADQYVLDYAHSYGLPTCVFRMSCIYGPHQRGTEDQGWVAHFMLRAIRDEAITVFGDGRQVRDLLYVEDLVDALLAASANERALNGGVFNIGGGPANAVSVSEVIEMIGSLIGAAPEVAWDDWRVADQRYYVSDTSTFTKLTGWKPRVSVESGLGGLHDWLSGARVRRRAVVAAGGR